MFFQISQLFWLFADPPTLLAVAALVGLVLLKTAWKRLGQSLIFTVLMILMLIAVTPVSHMTLRALESRFPKWQDAGAPIDGIVVLGGSISPELYFDHTASGLNSASGRLVAAADLAKRFKNARLVYTGGPAAAPRDEAEASKQILMALGVEESRIEIERDSLNTFENAQFSKRTAKPKPGERWLLVTSAMHMPRAIGCFRAAGFEVEAYPVDYHMPDWKNFSLDNLGLVNGLSITSSVYHEFVGMIVYRLTGKTNALYPAP